MKKRLTSIVLLLALGALAALPAAAQAKRVPTRPFIHASGAGTIETTTYPGLSGDWPVTGTATIWIHAHSVGDPVFHFTSLGEKYAACDAMGLVFIRVRDAGFKTVVIGRVTKMTTMREGVHGVSIDYTVWGRTYNMYITDGPTYDTVWLGFLAPILGDGHAYEQQRVIAGDFDVECTIPLP